MLTNILSSVQVNNQSQGQHMEYEFQQEGLPPVTKQTFIYKKHPASTNKAITRKMRQSQITAQGDVQNSTATESAYPGAGKMPHEEARASQIEAETIATQNASGISPRGNTLSQGGIHRLDSEVIATSENPRRAPNYTRFHKSQRGHASTGQKFSSYYEDNIDSETEVFIDPQFESRLALPTDTKEEARNRKAETFLKETVPKPRQSKRNRSGDVDDPHFNLIDGVINSNYDDQTKQRMISDIQDKYRSSQGQGRTEPNKMYKPRNQKKYKDLEEDGLEKSNRAIYKAFQNQDGTEMQSNQNQLKQGLKTAKSKQKHQRKPVGGKESDQIHHQQYLMPEMNELIGEQVEKRNYLTQDELSDPRILSDSRHVQTGGKRKRRKQREPRINESMDDGVAEKHTSKNFTPGRIRASRMRTNQNITDYTGKKDNYFKSPANQETEMFANAVEQHRGNKKKSRQQPYIESVDQNSQSMLSVEDNTKYLEILPAVKVKPKRKKRSPSSQSNHNNSIGHSASRMSTQNAPKLRDTLDQNLHYVQTSIKVPLKQTNFYDEKHDSGVTQQQLQTWKIKNGAVLIDAFDMGKKVIPANRHRIPDVGGGQNMMIGSGTVGRKDKKSKSPPNGQYIWDMDGRRHSKPKKKTERTVITSNATVFKVALPGITKSTSGKAEKAVRNSQSFGKKSEKFIDLGSKPKVISPNNSNGQSDVLVDLEVPVRGPQTGPPTAAIQHSPSHSKKNTSSEPPKRNVQANKSGSLENVSIEAGVVVPPEVDPRGYIKLVEKQRKKLQKKTSGKIIVEDDFVEPNDFRDPGGRKNQPGFPSNSDLSPPQKKQLARDNSNVSKKSKNSKNKNSKKSKSPLRSQSGTKSRDPSNDQIENERQLNIRKVTTEQGSIPRSNSHRKSTREPASPMIGGTIQSSAANLLNVNPSKTPLSGSPAQKSRSILRSRQADTVNSDIDAHQRHGRFNIQSRGQDQKTEFVGDIADKGSVNNQIEMSSLDRGSLPGPHPPRSGGGEDEGPDYGNQAVRNTDKRGSTRSSKNIPIDLHTLGKPKSNYTASQGQVRFVQNNFPRKEINSHQALEHIQINDEYNNDHSRQQMIKNHLSMEIAVGKQVSLGSNNQENGLEIAADQPSRKRKKSKKNQSSNNEESAQMRKQIKRMNTDQFTVGSKAIGGKRNSTNSRSNKSHSHSPEVKRVMESLTHHRVKIDAGTKLLINGTEVLTHQGIKGNIHKVGVGFGTGRHTSGRRLDLLKEVPFVANKTQSIYVKPKSPQTLTREPKTPKRAATPPSPEPPLPDPIYTPSIIVKAPSHRAPIRFDAQTQHLQETQSAGCEPYTLEMRSERIQAQVSQHDINLSARAMTAPPEKESIAVSARPISACSLREQGDQVTEGRFEPILVNTQMNTDGQLFSEYLKKETKEMNVGTDPIIFGEPKPQKCTIMIQTDPMVQEYNIPDEPTLLTLAYEPVTLAKNFETGSNGSLLEVPAVEEMFEIILPPPQEPEEPEPITDDWAYSRLYQHVYESHFDKMVKKRLISTSLIQRPSTAKSQEGMTMHQRYEHNLNFCYSPDGRTILSQIECEYGQQALKHKSANYRDQSMLLDLYTRAVTTIEVLVANMVRPDICNAILFAHYKEVTKKNVIKLLLRVKRLYEARNESVNILKLVMEIEAHIQPKSNLWRIIQDNTRSRLSAPFHDFLKHTLKILSNGLTRITIFQQEHHLFNDEFKFNQKEYRDYIRDIGRIIGGFLQLKKEVNPALQETGLLLEEHSEHAEQAAQYNEWVDASLRDFGRMDVPTDSEIKQTLEAEMPKERASKIDNAVQKMRETQREKSEKDSFAFDMSSKSRILEQMQLKANKLENLQIDSDQWQKTAISDQMLDRIQESAEKRKRLAQRAKEREEKRARGESDTDEHLEVPVKKLFGKNLILQQMQYDNEMEYNQTEDMNDNSQKGHQKHSSGFVNSREGLHDDLSENTHQHVHKKAEVIVTPRGEFAQFQQINIGRFVFDSASEALQSEAPIGDAYEEPKIMIPNLRLSHRHKMGEHSKSVSDLISDRSPRKQQILENKYQIAADDKSQQLNQQPHGADLQSNNVTPSECTAQPQRTNIANNPIKIQREMPPSHLSEMDEMTEFTEQQEFKSYRIARETEHSLGNINDVSGVHLSDLDQTELGNQDNYYLYNQQLNVLTQGSIKIKYQQSAHQKSETPSQQRTALRMVRHDPFLNDSEAQSRRDSINDRSQQ